MDECKSIVAEKGPKYASVLSTVQLAVLNIGARTLIKKLLYSEPIN